jgi:Na+/proline symporter
MTSAVAHDARGLILVVAFAYLAALIGISLWASRRTRTAADFFVAGNGIGLVALTVASVSTTVSGFAFIGGPGLFYRTGFGALYIILSASITNVLGAWVLAKRMRLLAAVRPMLTVGDAIAARYNSVGAQGIAGGAMLIGVVGYVATNALAMGVVVDTIFGTGLTAGIWFGMGITLAYSVTGGMLAGIYNDVLQGVLMAVASVLVFVVVWQLGPGIGGHARSILAADPQFLGPFGTMSPMAALSLFFVFAVGSLGQPAQIHKYYMLRDPLQLRWYPMLKTLGLLVVLLLYFGVGLAVKSLVVRGQLAPLERPDDATPTFLLHHTPQLLAALVFSGVMAATTSITNSFLNIGAAVITHDLPRALGTTVRNPLRSGRYATIAIALAAMAVATASKTMVAFLGVFGYGLFASTLVPALAIGLNWRGATRVGAISSMMVGIGLTLCMETLAFLKVLTIPSGVSIAGLSLAASLTTFFVVSLLTRDAQTIPEDVGVVMEV